MLSVETLTVVKPSTTDFPSSIQSTKKRSKRFKAKIERSNFTPLTFPVPGDPQCAQNYLDFLYICDPDVWLGHTDAIRLDQILSTSKFVRCAPQENNVKGNNTVPSTSSGEHRPEFANQGENSRYSIGLGLVDALNFDDLQECRSYPGNESSVKNIDIEYEEKSFRHVEERAILETFLKKAAKILKRRWNIRRISTLTHSSSICGKDIFILMIKSFAVCIKNQVVVFKKRGSTSTKKLSPMISVVFGPRVKSVINEATFVKLINGLSISQSGNDLSNPLPENFHSAFNIISRMFLVLETSLPGIDRVKDPKLSTDGDQDGTGVRTTSTDVGKMSSVVTDEITRKFRSIKYHVPQWAVATFVVTGGLSVICFSVGHFISTGLRSKSRFSNPEKKSLFYKTGHRRWRAGFAGGMVEMRHNGCFAGGAGSSMGGSNLAGHQPANPISLAGFPLKLSKSRPLAGGGIGSGGVNVGRHGRQKHSRGATGFGASKNSYSRV